MGSRGNVQRATVTNPRTGSRTSAFVGSLDRLIEFARRCGYVAMRDDTNWRLVALDESGRERGPFSTAEAYTFLQDLMGGSSDTSDVALTLGTASHTKKSKTRKKALLRKVQKVEDRERRQALDEKHPISKDEKRIAWLRSLHAEYRRGKKYGYKPRYK